MLKKPLFLIILLVFKASCSIAQIRPITVSNRYNADYFPLVSQHKAAKLYVDQNDAEVVHIAATDFSKDVELITGVAPAVVNQTQTATDYPVIIGTLGKSKMIDELAKSGKIDASKVRGKWETFSIGIVNNPFKNVKQALIIFGSDRRGTAFGVFELSRMMGVSPLVWWADVKPEHQDGIYVSPGISIEGPPSVKYRGIFLNDEDWGLQPWAAKNIDPDVKDIGPKTYEKIFELLLRLKANYIWPAMHPCTKAFWYYKDNPKMADKYAIVLGASHCEPMLRNNVFEWADNYQTEYGVKPGEWRYDLNKQQIYNYWDDRLKESHNIDAVYTVGMRGIHDGSMPGPKSATEKVKLLEQVIKDQREILNKRIGKPAEQVPQIFCPYKEVLNLYQAGMKLPDDVTIAWADDNHGYIRQLSDPEEQKRSGGAGVYYHLSYWGSPNDYLWLSSISPSLTSYEMTKAYNFGAGRLWVFNVGDLKPAEMEIQFSMDLAWDVKRWSPENAGGYARSWAAETFGPQFADEIAQIKATYFRLAAAAKPEHMNVVNFTIQEADQRLKDYQSIAIQAEALAAKMPSRLKDAFFELIRYPVEGARLMNEKILYARKAQITTGEPSALYAKQAKAAYDRIQELTAQYNTSTAGGKWNGIMSSHPRDQKVFKMPDVEPATDRSIIKIPEAPSQIIPASAYLNKKDSGSSHITTIDGLGIDGKGISVMPFIVKSFEKDQLKDAPYVEYQVNLAAGDNQITIKCLPTFRIYAGLNMRYAISINQEEPQFVDLNTKAESKAWEQNVLRGYMQGETVYHSATAAKATVRIYMTDPSLVISQIAVAGS